jgi:hypothetical protein
MMTKIEDCGKNAGKVWDTLNTHGSLTERTLMRKTNLAYDELYSAIGWLAKENKVSKEERYYTLRETNMSTNIGKNAGKIWSILNTWGEIDTRYLQKLADISKNDTYLAIGWLAKEGKLKTKVVRPKKPQLFVELK